MPGLLLCSVIPGMVNIGQLIANGGPSARDFFGDAGQPATALRIPYKGNRQPIQLDTLYAAIWVILSQFPSPRSCHLLPRPEDIFRIFRLSVSDETQFISLEICCCPVYNSIIGDSRFDNRLPSFFSSEKDHPCPQSSIRQALLALPTSWKPRC
jgi:hypothetical protein